MDSRYAAHARRLDELEKRLSQGRFHLAVLGQVKRGKSTLLNALLGEDVLPSSVVPLTAIPTFIQYGDTDRSGYDTSITARIRAERRTDNG